MSEGPKHVIDVHTHVFNNRYLPLKGLARSKVWDPIADSVAAILNEVTRSSFPETDHPPEFLYHIGEKELSKDYADALWQLVRHTMLLKGRYFDKIFQPVEKVEAIKALRNDVITKSLVDIVHEYNKEHPDEAININDKLPSVLMESLSTGKSYLDHLSPFKKAVKWAFKKFADLLRNSLVFGDKNLDTLEFLYTLTRDEKSMLQKIIQEYRNNQSVRLYVHYMMDMEHGCEEAVPPYYEFFPTQCENMLHLAAYSQGMLIGFSAFDPRRADWEIIFEKSLSMGFVGFKFYPSMGFLPINNTEDPVIDERVEAFLLKCIEFDVPVVTHCTPKGFQFKDGDGVKAHPKYWRARLEKAGFENLRLNFGHAGGGYQQNEDVESWGWFASNPAEWDNPDNYAKIVEELCNKYDNVYCDISYMLKLYENTEAGKIVRKNFERNFFKSLSSGRFSQKIMYGSDWNMPNIIDETDSYLDYYLKLFSHNDFLPYREKFFWMNALNYLNISKYNERLDELNINREEVLIYAQALKKKCKQLIEG